MESKQSLIMCKAQICSQFSRYESKVIVLKSMELGRICPRVNERRIWLILCMTRDCCPNCGLAEPDRLGFHRSILSVAKGWSWQNGNHRKHLTGVFMCIVSANTTCSSQHRPLKLPSILHKCQGTLQVLQDKQRLKCFSRRQSDWCFYESTLSEYWE